jgi:DNA-binding transcriptional LysR family regulator
MKLSLESLQWLVVVAERGSFSAAARVLGKAQSAVSTAIANLEIDLGLTLFDRSGRLPRLTLAGERMVAEARALLAQQGQLQAVAAELAAGVEARLTLAIDDGSLLPWLAPVLEQLAGRYPSLELELLFPMMEDLDEMLLSGRAQLGVGYQGMTTPAALARFGLGQMAMPLVVAPGHPLAQMAAPALADLGRYRQLLVTGRQPGVERERFRLSTTIWWAEGDLSVLELVKRGLGWASVPAFLLTDALARGEVVRLPDAALPAIPALPIELLWPSARALGPAAQWLRQALQAHRL